VRVFKQTRSNRLQRNRVQREIVAVNRCIRSLHVEAVNRSKSLFDREQLSLRGANR
jgi:hypothetical protein